MKTKKILSYVFGTMMLFWGIILLFTKDVGSIMAGISLLLIAILIYPTFNYICKLCNKNFSIGRKVALGIGTFLIAPFLFSSEEITYSHISTYIIVVLIFWIIMFATNKNQFIDIENRTIEEESDKTDIFHKFYNSIIRKRNAKVIAAIEYENKIKENFYDLDIMTTNAIAKMIGETREKHHSVFNTDMPEVNISELVMAFCKDSQNMEDEYELNSLYSETYYISKINKYCSELSTFIKFRIRETLPSQNRNRYVEFYNNYIRIFMESMSTFTSIKFYKTISSYGQDYDGAEKLFEEMDYRFKDSMRYLIDALATCTCISKMIFVERKVKQLNENSEFYKIISNMAKEIKDVDAIIKKSRPVYDEFYKSTLGFINDELLYGIAIATMANRINHKDISKKDEEIANIQEEKITNLSTLDIHMREWIKNVAENHRSLEIDRYILYKITNTIDITNFDLLLNSLGRTNEYANLYYDSVEHNNKVSDKDRYLKGDVEKEKIELSGKYTLNNITTGTQFELYLVNLFKDLGYKAKHNGKSGDQGADLILKKGDYVYAVQAKYYTGKLSNTPVQEIAGALKFYNANQGVVVTNSEFTPGAEELAKANNVILIDGKDLKKLADYTFEDDHSEDVLKKFEK